MSFSRIISTCTGLLVLISLLASPTSCDQGKTTYYQLKVACTTMLNVNSQTGVDLADAYVCKNTKITWNANDHIFFVFFKHDCPFGANGCKEIDNQHPTAGPITSDTFTVYDYGIVVDGKLFDPHIIGGGGQ
jgi:hypothetical protein